MSKIRIIKATNNPLSADVIIYEGQTGTWVYDVGRSDESYKLLQQLPAKNIVISHFHPDHMANLDRLSYDNLYIGNNTFKYTKHGTVVDEILEVEENIRIIPMPSSHAKGSLALQIGRECLLVGDGLYPQHKGYMRVYNVQHLRAQIELIEHMDVRWIGLSHRPRFFQEKGLILAYYKDIYNRRNKNEAFVVV